MAIAYYKLAQEVNKPNKTVKLSKPICANHNILNNSSLHTTCEIVKPTAPLIDNTNIKIFGVTVCFVILLAGLWYLWKKGYKS